MNKNAAIINLPVKKETTKSNPSIVTYLNENWENRDLNSLYKAGFKNLMPVNVAGVCCIKQPLKNKFNQIIKRTVDIILSVIVIGGLLFWLIPLLAIGIKISSRGPVFFLQKRNKKNGAVFTCIKFRSMIVNDTADILPAGENDKRITAIGRIMRKTFIDELPQFFNVLSGDMSVIGPRPHMLKEHLKFESLVPHYNFRDNVKPGITGLSQVAGLEGPANTIIKMSNRVTADNIYIRNWSLKLDLIIMFRTICKIAGTK